MRMSDTIRIATPGVRKNAYIAGTLQASSATNIYIMTGRGFTNTGTRSIRFFEVTGSSIVFSNSVSVFSFSFGTPSGLGLSEITLNPYESLTGTGCATAGGLDQ